MIEVGDRAPDFTLRNQFGEVVSLGDLRGRPVLILFFPWAFSSICRGELCEIRDGLGELGDVEVVGISCDALFSQRAWAEQQGFHFPLLSDFWPHGEVARAYGIFDEGVGVSVRGSFLIDADGIVRWRVVNGIGEARSFMTYLENVAKLSA